MAQAPLVIRGGLDLTSPVTMASPGTLRECLNYERGLLEGQTRMDGFRPVDGATIDSLVQVWNASNYRIYKVYRNAVSGFPSASSIVSSDFINRIQFFRATSVEYDPFTFISGGFVAARGVYLGAPLGVTDYFCVALAPGYYLSPGLHNVSINASLFADTTQALVASFAVLVLNVEEGSLSDADPNATQQYLDDAIDYFISNPDSTPEQVPGGEGSDIVGLFWLKNRLYAIRDLVRYYFDSGLYTDANEGQFVTIGSSEYEILNVRQLGGGSGVLTLNPVAGSGTDATGISAPALYSLSGDFTGNIDVGASYSSGPLTQSGGTAIEWRLLDDAFATSTLIDADAPGLLGQQTDAALWKSDADNGWERIDLGREMLFSDATTALTNFVRDATLDGAEVKTTGAKFPTASTFNGSTTTGINADDGMTQALSGGSGDIFVAAGFDFSSIPSSAIIRGITVTIERQSNTANQAKDNTVTLLNITGGAENKARGVAWPNAIATTTYGGASDLWGNQSISVSDLQDSDFGVLLIADRFASGTAATGGVDYVSVTVYYVERDTPAYVWNGTSDVDITIRHVQFLGGDTTDASAYGYLTITAAQNADKTRLINVGDEIRSAANGGGTLLAEVAARDVPIFFPGQTDLENNASQYRTEVANFYSSDQLDAAFIVCGVGPCTSYDGARTIRIRTQLPAQDDNPRHVARFGEKLFLGYYSGIGYLSQATNPYEMRTEEGASTVPFGDRITGARKLSGDRLLVPCAESVQMLSGYTTATLLRETITNKRGMLEYSDCDMGIVLGCDGLGIFDVASASSFGPAQRNYLSVKVAPWLQPRLQATDNTGQPATRLRTAMAFRSKNQGRWYMEDGWVLTLTAEDPIEFTLQRYTAPSVGNRPLSIRAICSGLDAGGRERVFATFRGMKEGYVFELDSGRSFDGDAIPAYIVLNPIAPAGGVSQIVRTDRWFVYGAGYGVANLTCSRAVDYGTPDSSVTQPLVMGDEANPATSMPTPMRGVVDFPIEGEDLILRFDSNTGTEGPHTLQLTNIFIDSRGASRGYTGKG